MPGGPVRDPGRLRLLKERPRDDVAIEEMTAAYARDPMGGNAPLDAAVLEELVPGLQRHPTTLVWLAWRGGRVVGIATCFLGFSTFAARPVINVHDLCVIARADGNLKAIADWVAKTDWVDFLARVPETRSNTSVCLQIVDPAVKALSDDKQAAVAKKIAATVRALGLGRFQLKYSAGPLPHARLMRSIELYGTRVAPLVRDAFGGQHLGYLVMAISMAALMALGIALCVWGLRPAPTVVRPQAEGSFLAQARAVSRHGSYTTLLAAFFLQALATAAMLAAAQREAAAKVGLRGMGEAYVRFALAHPERFQLMFGGVVEIGRHPQLREVATRTFDALSGALAGASPPSRGASDASVAAWALV